MKALLTLIIIAAKIAIASENYKVVIVPECIQAHHIEINMHSPQKELGGASIVLKGMADALDQLEVSVDKEQSFHADCQVTLEKSGEDVVVHVSFDADLEDGRNTCSVNIKRPNGKTLTAELYIDVIDF